MQDSLKILIINNSQKDVKKIRMALKNSGADTIISVFNSTLSALDKIASRKFDIILMDTGLSDDINSIFSFRDIRKKLPQVPVLVMSDSADEDTAIRLIQEGAEEYLIKSEMHSSLLLRSIRNTIDRKKASRNLQETNAHLNAMIQGFDGLIYLCSEDYRVEFMNEQLIKRTGYNGTGKLCYKVIHDRDSICPWCVNKQVFRGETVRWEIQSPKDNRWYYIVNTPIYKPDGKMAKQALIQDITDRKNIENSLSERDAQLQAVFHGSAIGMFMGNIEDGRILYSNIAFQNMLGFSESELKGMHFSEITHPDDFVNQMPFFQELVVGNRDWYQLEKRYRKKAAGFLWVKLTVSVSRNPSGSADLAICMAENINDRKQLELALQQSYDDLESRVNERTLELLTANESLVSMIKEKNEIEEELRESEERYRSIVEHSHEGIVITNDKMEIIFVNGEMCRISGYSREEMLGRQFSEILNEQDSQTRLYRYIRRQKGEPFPSTYEVCLICKDGEKRYGELRLAIFRDSTGCIRSVLQFLDITERKEAERALHETRMQQKALLDNIPDIAWIKDSNSIYIATNEPFRVMCGAKVESLSGMTDYDLWPKDFADKYRSDDETVIKYGKRIRFEEPIVDSTGKAFWLETVKTPIFDEKGNIIGSAGIARDITERKKVETLILSERQRFFALLEELPVFIYLKDKNHLIRFANNAFKKLFGDPEGRTSYQVLQGLEDHHPYSIPSQNSENMQHQTREWHNIEADRIYQIYNYPFTDTDGSSLFLEMGIDITDFRRAEKQLHEYQGQLRSLSSQLILAEEKERRRIAVDLHDYIGQNLAYCKIKLGEVIQQPNATPFGEILVEIRELIEQTIQYTRTLTYDLSPPILYELGFEPAVEWLGEQIITRRGINFTFHNDEQPKPINSETGILIFQSVRELLINASKHSQADQVSVSIRKTPDSIVIDVIDNGIGFNTSQYISEKKNATSYGLFSISERFKNISGDFIIDSGPGQGSRATIIVPIE